MPTETPAPWLPEGTPEIVSTTSAGEGFERTLTVVLSGQPGTDVALRIDGERRADATLAADGRATVMIPTNLVELYLGSLSVAYTDGDATGPWLTARLRSAFPS